MTLFDIPRQFRVGGFFHETLRLLTFRFHEIIREMDDAIDSL